MIWYLQLSLFVIERLKYRTSLSITSAFYSLPNHLILVSVFHECLLQMYNPVCVILWIEKRIQSLTVGIWSVPSFYYYYYWRYNSTLQMHRGITKDVLKFYSMKFSSAFNNIWFGHDVKMLYPFIQWTIQGNGFNKRLLATDLQIIMMGRTRA